MGILSPIVPQLGTFLRIARLVCMPVQHRLRNERASLQNSIFDFVAQVSKTVENSEPGTLNLGVKQQNSVL
jgi:hypothetical protein